MAKYQYGCLLVEAGEFNTRTGASSNWQEIEIYQDSIVIDQPEANRTDHFKQGDPNAKVSRFERVTKTIAFSIMDLSAKSKSAWLGGAVTTVNEKESWNEPLTPVNSVIKSLRFTLEDGSVITVPNAECVARLSSNLNETEIAQIPVTAVIKSTGVDGLAALSWTD